MNADELIAKLRKVPGNTPLMLGQLESNMMMPTFKHLVRHPIEDVELATLNNGVATVTIYSYEASEFRRG